MPRKTNRLRDWLFGSPTKRLLLATVLADPTGRWTKASLARETEAHEKGGLDEHLLALVQLGVLAREGRQYELAVENPLVDPLRQVLATLERVPDEALDRP